MPVNVLPDDIYREIQSIERRLSVLENTNPLEHGSITASGYFYQVDSNGVIRFELGNLPARGNSAAQIGWRVNDASGNPIADSTGLLSASVLKLLGSVTNVSQSGVTGNGSWQTVSGSSISLPSFTRPTNVLAFGAATVVDPTVGDTGFNLEGTVLVDGAQNNANGPVFAPGTASFTMTGWALLSGITGAHSVALGVNQTNTHLWTAINGYLFAFQWGG